MPWWEGPGCVVGYQEVRKASVSERSAVGKVGGSALHVSWREEAAM